jgi:hypothetical protein
LKLTPKQKEQLRRPRPFLFLLIIGAFGLPWLLLFKNGVHARRQQAQMSVQSKAFFAPFNTYPRNASAKQFDRLGANLGFVPNDPRSLIYRVNPEAEQAYYRVEEPLGQFLHSQTAKVSGPLAAIPPELTTYLKAVKPDLDALQAHILNSEAPLWELNAERMSEQNYPFPGLVNTLNTQKLLLLSAIDAHQRHQPSQMISALEASWQLNQAIAQRPDLVSQVSASVVAEYQAGLLRHFDEVPVQWSARLAQQAQQLSVVEGLEFDVWLQYQSLQKSLALVVTRSGMGMQALSYWFSPVYAFNLANIDTAQTAHRALAQLSSLDVCTASQATAEAILAKEETAEWNEAIAPVPAVLARRWKVEGDRALAQELTQQVLQAKQQAQVTQQWPENIADQASLTCSKEHWSYRRESDNTVTISFSTALMPAPAVPLSYHSLPLPVPATGTR